MERRLAVFLAMVLLPSVSLASGRQGAISTIGGGSGSVSTVAGGAGSVTTATDLSYDAPTGFQITATSQTISTATWNAVLNPNATSYTLQYASDSVFSSITSSSDTLNTTAMVSGLTANTQYYARVRGNPDGKFSQTESTTTPNVSGGSSFVSDDFNRANGNLGGSTSSSGAAWATGAGALNGDITIVSNAAVPQTFGGDTGMLYISSQTGAANYTVSADFILTSSLKSAGKLIFALSASDWIGCGWGGGGEWQCFENGTQEGSDGTGDTPTSSVTMSIEVTGTSYVFKVNGNTKVSGQTIGFSHLGLTGIYLYYNESGSGESWDNIALTVN